MEISECASRVCSQRKRRRLTRRLNFAVRVAKFATPISSLVFQADDIEVPAGWSQVACDVLAQKYFRKAGVPSHIRRVPEDNVPEWLWRGAADDAALETLPEESRFGGETRPSKFSTGWPELDVLGLERWVLRW